eukprot:CAMPEP_0171201972 /NCGR_PEP_ID=MMETSP0790-20130122/24763_1 /TAXON_ID=2925 /ORGANISM="Alexandrium catenella, Strain OF101" /LENGTH=143 /DNA_ID=CAMNT_0011667383 /DNA_START=82 /DNA_END=513 /DNA_ORIENTATION=+
MASPAVAFSRKKSGFVNIFLYGQELALPHEFFEQHPGGDEMILHAEGRDCTAEFEAIGHSQSALNWARTYALKPEKMATKVVPAPADDKAGFGGRALSALGSLVFQAVEKHADIVENSNEPSVLALALFSVASATLAWQLWKV